MFEILKKKLLDTGIFYNNEWLDKYINLIIINKDQIKIKFMTHKHHIIPKYYYEMNNIDIDNSAQNIVNLIFNDHALAHYYLALASVNKRLLYKNYQAIKFICNLDSERFENITEEWLVNELPLLGNLREEAMRVQGELSSERLKGEGNWIYGKHHSEETKAKISKSCLAAVTPEKRKILSDYGKARDNSKQVAAMAYHNSHFRDYTETGKKISQTKKLNGSGNNRANKLHIINNYDNTEKYIKPEDLEKYIDSGWSIFKPKWKIINDYRADLKKKGWLGVKFVYLYNNNLYIQSELEEVLHNEGFNIHWKGIRNIVDNGRSRYYKELLGKIVKLHLTPELFYSYFDSCE